MSLFSVDKNSPIPYYYQIEEWLRDQIASGSLKPGDLIPSEKALCEQLGISRITIRQALADLTAEGLLERSRGKGTHIAHRRQVVTFRHQWLRGITEDAAAMGLAVRSQVLKQELVSAPEDAMLNMGVPRGTPLILVRRLRSIQNMPIVVETVYHPYARFPELLEMDLNDCSIYEILNRLYDARPVQALDRLVAEPATKEIAKLLEIRPGSPVMHSIRIARDKTGQIMEFTISIYRADQYQFEIEYKEGE
jgi:GntR family transcriptional regulator